MFEGVYDGIGGIVEFWAGVGVDVFVAEFVVTFVEFVVLGVGVGVGGEGIFTRVTLSIQGPINGYKALFPIENLGSKHNLLIVVFAVKT